MHLKLLVFFWWRGHDLKKEQRIIWRVSWYEGSLLTSSAQEFQWGLILKEGYYKSTFTYSQKYKCNTFVLAPIFDEIDAKI